MATLTLSNKDINELLTVLNVALTDARLQQQSAENVRRDSHDWPFSQEEINTNRAYMDTIRKWIHIFSQQIGAPDLLEE